VCVCVCVCVCGYVHLSLTLQFVDAVYILDNPTDSADNNLL